MQRIGIIGGGAAGCMAAATILLGMEHEDFELMLIEKNTELGKKVRISGGGRCNVTTGITDKKEVLQKYIRGSQTLKFGIGKYGPKKTREWFEENGVQLKCEADNRIFPVSNNSQDVMNVFESIFKNSPQAKVLYGKSVSSISDEATGAFTLTFSTGEEMTVDYLMITTGGNAYRKTGSTGDGYKFGEMFGHSITQLGPSLSSFVTNNTWMHDLSGIVLDKAQFKNQKNQLHYQTAGTVLFTHFGMSGPGVFALSAEVAYDTISKNNPLELMLLPLASWGVEAWEKYLQTEFQGNSSKIARNILKELLPSRFVDTIGKEFALEEILGRKGSIISKSERQRISALFGGGIPLSCLERRPGDEFVTAGGISNEEIDKETFESRLRKKLFFAGEILNIDGLTGGFNLQCAWTTGRLAGDEIVKQITNR